MVNGIPQVRAMFRRKAKAVVEAGKTAARQGGEETAAAMRYLAPREQGKLIASIRVEDASTVSTGKGDRGFIGVKVKAGDSTTIVTNDSGGKFQNARIQEFGTENMSANPYFFPAWRSGLRTRVRGKISRSIRKAWKDG